MRTHNQPYFDPRKVSVALPSTTHIDTKSGGLLQSDEYQRLMMVKDPAERAKSSRFGANYANVKQTAALQTGLGAGGMLNRDFSRSSGFRVHDAFN